MTTLAWEKRYLDRAGRYVGPPMSRWGFRIAVGTVVPQHLHYAFAWSWSEANSRRIAR